MKDIVSGEKRGHKDLLTLNDGDPTNPDRLPTEGNTSSGSRTLIHLKRSSLVSYEPEQISAMQIK